MSIPSYIAGNWHNNVLIAWLRNKNFGFTNPCESHQTFAGNWHNRVLIACLNYRDTLVFALQSHDKIYDTMLITGMLWGS